MLVGEVSTKDQLTGLSFERAIIETIRFGALASKFVSALLISHIVMRLN